MWKLQLLCWICAILRLNITFSVRFVPHQQKRNDTRGRTVAWFDADAAEAWRFYQHAIRHPSTIKEKEHGNFYLCIEARTKGHDYRYHGKVGDERQQDAFAGNQPTGEVYAGTPSQAAEKPAPAHAQETVHAQGLAAEKGGSVHRLHVQPEAAARPGKPVEDHEVSLKDIGVK